jgi:hypothetical protein
LDNYPGKFEAADNNFHTNVNHIAKISKLIKNPFDGIGLLISCMSYLKDEEKKNVYINLNSINLNKRI